MHYICNDCKNEFDFDIIYHEHQINNFLSIKNYGCPICNKALTKNKICPKCGSNNLKEYLKKEEK